MAIACSGALVVLLACWAPAAPASHKPKIDEFGSAGAQGGQFSGARGIAINLSGTGGVAAGTVYVADNGNRRVQSFDQDGNFIRAWGWDVVASGAPNDTGTGFEVCDTTAGNVPADCQQGSAGASAGQFAANSLTGGVAVNQSTGDVYVVDRTNSRIQQFTATGAFVRTWGQAGGKGGEFGFGSSTVILGIATDSSGNVYVSDAENARVQKFDSQGNFLAAGGWDVDSANPSLEYEVCTVAANCQKGALGIGAGQYAAGVPSYLTAAPSGDVYVVGRGDGTIYHLLPGLGFDPAFAPAEVPSGGSSRNPLSFSGGHLFFAKFGANTSFHELDPVTQLIVHEYPAEGNEWVGLAVNSLNGRIYATRTTGATFVRVFGEPDLVVTIEPPEPTSWTRATLKGTVTPNGAEVTECVFKYGPTAAYGNEAPCAETAGEIGTGTSPVPVHADISGLAPDGATTYHARLFAAIAGGAGESLDLAFSTPDAVQTDPASAIGAAGATLNGKVNPVGQAVTECVFEYGPTTAYGNEAPCAETAGEIGTGTSPVAVHADVAGLGPGSDYHFRLKAANATDAGAVSGEDRDFQTLGPAIEETWSEDVSDAEAVLKAEIDPEGQATTYRFEYDTVPYATGEGPHGISAPVPDGAVGSDSAPHEVSVRLRGLASGTSYHYRVVAGDASAIVNRGPDRALFTYERSAPGADACPNAALRAGAGASASLPDCRAYEMVSPTDKGGGDILVRGSGENGKEDGYRQASATGERVTYTSNTAFGDARRGAISSQYLSSRGAEGWSTHGLNPPLGASVFDPEPVNGSYDEQTNMMAFSADLCLTLLRDHNLPPLSPEAIAGFTNLYLRENCGAGADTYLPITTGAPPLFKADATFNDLRLNYASFTADEGKIVFGAEAALEVDAGVAPAAGINAQVYEYGVGTGELRLVSVLPGGEAATEDSAAGSIYGGFGHRRGSPLQDAVSTDGSTVFWTVSEVGLPNRIFARRGGASVAVSASSNHADFVGAASDGSAALYTEGETLYELDVDAAFAEEAGARTAIAGEVGGLLGASEDLSRIYFTSRESLAAGAPGTLAAGEYNVYLRREGEPATVTYIATVSAADRGVDMSHGPEIPSTVDGSPIAHSSRVSPDGQWLAFMSNRRLTGYDNTDAATGEAVSEVYVYDAQSEVLHCASCRPSGARPAGRKVRGAYHPDLTKLQAAAWLPTFEWGNHGKRTLAAGGGRLFFNSFDALSLRDSNGAQDVYQWEVAGRGSCTPSSPSYSEANGGCVELISSGRSPADSELLDASLDGSDVFFTTAESLDPARDSGSIDVYDAREGGGFPPPPLPPPACLGDACQPVPAAPGAQTPASVTFRGPGNVKARPRCRRGKVRRKGRCVAKRASRRARRSREGRTAR